jgi:hypothetical protein
MGMLDYAVSLLFWSGGRVAGWLAGEVGPKTNLSPVRASLLGLSLAERVYKGMFAKI